MNLAVDHPWNVTPEEAMAIQSELSRRVVREDAWPSEPRTIAGVDVHYDKDSDAITAGIAVLARATLELAEVSVAVGRTDFPYVPGLFSFRELPLILRAIERLETVPDLVVCDGQGLAHPRRFGLACHLGVVLDIPTIGCGKSRYIGSYQPPGEARGCHSPLLDGEEEIGSVLRTQTGVKPVFVSIGHRVSLPTARRFVLELCTRYRLPETTRAADHLVRTSKKPIVEP